jgi:hypothetical protein
MSIIPAYAHGIGEAVRRPKMAGLLWLANVLFALPAYLFFSNALGDALGRSGTALDLEVFLEILIGPSGLVNGVLGLVFLGLALAALVSPFLHGGILQVLIRGGGERVLGPAFFSGGARYYGRFLALALYSAVLWLPALAVFVPVHIAMRAALEGSTDETLGVILVLVRAGLALLLVSAIRMVMDYARIRIVREETPVVLGSLAWAVRFVLGRLGRTALLYGLMCLTGWSMLAVYLGLDGLLGRAAGGAGLPTFLLAQLYIAGRGALRVAFQAAQLRFASEA